MRTLSLWLTGVILLTVVAVLGVFKPITFAPRKDPSDADRYLRPLMVDEKNIDKDNGRPKKASLPIGNKGFNVYLYKPQHDLRLGLDLRGGMRVVLQIPDRAEFVYTLKPALKNSDIAADKQKKLAEALLTEEALGTDTRRTQIIVSEEAVTVMTQPEDSAEAKDQLKLITAAVEKEFGAGKFDAPNENPKSKDFYYKSADSDTQNSVLSIMDKRLNSTGLSEVIAYAKGENQVVLEIPGVKNPDKVREVLGTTAQMEFRLIPQSINVSPDDENDTVTIMRGQTELSHEEAIAASYLVLPGRALSPNSEVTKDQKGDLAVTFEFRSKKDKEKFAAVTAGNIGRQLAIVLDGKVLSAPVIQDRIHGQGIITGNFDAEEAKELADYLNAGALPVPVDIVENRTVSATLGADSVALSLMAGLIGMAAVLIFIMLYYRLPGIMASIALIIYVFLTLAVLKVFDATLTLPGIAGIIISIGMAVDANVIIFERLKEELRTKKPLESAIDVAFNRAWTAILDSNVASLITGAILWWLGTGAVRGFAITLVIGVAVSMFTAITVTRLLMRLMIRGKAGHTLNWYGV